MNLIMWFVMGLIFITSLYGQSNSLFAEWFLIFGMVFSAFVMGYFIKEEL